MFLKKKKPSSKSSSLMTDIGEAEAPARPVAFDSEDAREILEDRLSAMHLRRNKQEKENIFSANSKPQKEAASGALYGLSSHKLDYSAMMEENRKALEDKDSSSKQPDFSFPPEEDTDPEELQSQPGNLAGTRKPAFLIDPRPADCAPSKPRPAYARVDIVNELEENFNNLKKSPGVAHVPDAGLESEEFVPHDLQKRHMEEEFRLRKLDHALEEHKESSKSSRGSHSPAQLRRDPHRRRPDPQDRDGRGQLHLHSHAPGLRRHGGSGVRRVREPGHPQCDEKQ